MAFGLGVFLFALGIAASIALHEVGHMATARLTGMRVRRFFVGFGPTLWATRRQHRVRNSPPAPDGTATFTTEYGLKAIPLGGFCDIAGMTLLDDLSEEEKPHAMHSKPARSRLLVLAGGILVNILLTLILVYTVAVGWGLPDRNTPMPATIAATSCVPAQQNPDGTLVACSGAGPAEQAGIVRGDTIIAINGVATPEFSDLTEELRHLAEGHQPGDVITATVDIRHNPAVDTSIDAGVTPPPAPENAPTSTTTMDIPVVERLTRQGTPFVTAAVGISVVRPDPIVDYNPISAIGGTVSFTQGLVRDTAVGLMTLPAKIPGVVASIFGAERAADSPMSVVGASRVGGELVSIQQWPAFLLVLASLNLFLAAFNLVPLPPLDGGHMAAVIWEKIRDGFRRRRGLDPLGPVDYTRLMPITYVATGLLLILGITTILADVINPIRLF